MASDRIPTGESIAELLDQLPPEEIDVFCLRIMMMDKTIHHWHYNKDGQWYQTPGNQG